MSLAKMFHMLDVALYCQVGIAPSLAVIMVVTEREISSSVSPIFNQIYICTVHPITFGSVLFCSIPDIPGFPASPYSLHGGESMYMHT